MLLPDGWQPVDGRMAQLLLEELRTEIGNGHVLSGANAKVIARRNDVDDVVLLLDDGRAVEVHLTWRETQEPKPEWPRSETFESVESWAKARVSVSKR